MSMKIDVGDMIILGDLVFVCTEMNEPMDDYCIFRMFKNQKDAELWLDRNRDKETDTGLN